MTVSKRQIFNDLGIFSLFNLKTSRYCSFLTIFNPSNCHLPASKGARRRHRRHLRQQQRRSTTRHNRLQRPADAQRFARRGKQAGRVDSGAEEIAGKSKRLLRELQ
ncbi:MAG: hypothetical protein WCV00_06280 [Verrucomicrobiia bacterium]|jgi:hypothetical protein